jgi:hypothetical protein
MSEPETTRGRPSEYRPEYVGVTKKLCELGATDEDVADALGVSVRTIYRWRCEHDEFCQALKVGKVNPDDRAELSLYRRVSGYSYPAVKIFMPAGADAPVYAEYREHVPPDVTACIFWLKNRRPEQWRDRKELTGPDGGPIEVTDARQRLAAKLEVIARRTDSSAEPGGPSGDAG